MRFFSGIFKKNEKRTLENIESLQMLFEKLLQTPPIEETVEILENHPELLSDETNDILEELIKEKRQCKDRESMQSYKWVHAFLKEFRKSQKPFVVEINQIKALQAEYIVSGDQVLLNKMVSTWERILSHNKLEKVSEDFYLGIINDSANTFIECYHTFGTTKNIERALSHLKKLDKRLSSSSSHLPLVLSNLSEVYRICYDVRHDLNDLENAVTCCRRAIDLTCEQSPERPVIMINLGNALLKRYEQKANEQDFCEAFNIFKSGVDNTGVDDSILQLYLNGLGNCLDVRFDNTQEIKYLDDAIVAYDKAIKLNKDKTPKKSIIFNNLISCLRKRHRLIGSLDDLYEADLFTDKAIEIAGHESPELPKLLLSELNLYLMKYWQSNNPDNLQKASNIPGKIAECNAIDTSIIIETYNLMGICSRESYEHGGKIEHLVLAIQAFQRAIQEAPIGPFYLPTLLHNLGTTYLLRYRHTLDIDNMYAAIDALQQSITLSPPDSPNLAKFHQNLGTSFRIQYEHDPKACYLQNAIDSYRQSLQSGNRISDEDIFMSAKNWLSWAFDRKAWDEVEEAYEYAFKANNRLVRLQLLQKSKAVRLGEMQGIAAKTSYALAMRNKTHKAVEVLEHGIARLLSESLALDSAKVEQLNTIGHGDLYQRYISTVDRIMHLKELLEKKEHDFLFIDTSPLNTTHVSVNLAELRTEQTELESIINSIRGVEGYEHFLMPMTFNNIRNAAKNCPIVYISATDAGGMAIIVRKRMGNNDENKDQEDIEVLFVGLPLLTSENVDRYVNSIQDHNKGYFFSLEDWHEELDKICTEIWSAVISQLIVFFPRISHVTFIPVGKTNLLPFHAAWTADPDSISGRRYALDDLVISYAPNAQSLTSSFALANRITKKTCFGIDEPYPVRKPRRYHSHQEVATVCSFFKDNLLLRGEEAKKDTVIEALNRYDVVHFSCHGEAKLSDPLKSKLFMAYNESITLEELIRLRFKGFRLVTLSACETGMPGTILPDEFLSLAVGLLSANAAGVISSLWRVSELSTMLLMISFYQIWTQQPNKTLSESLQEAQRWVRDSSLEEKKKLISEMNHKIHAVSNVLPPCGQFHKSDSPEFNLSVLDTINFQHPHYWAAFICLGV